MKVEIEKEVFSFNGNCKKDRISKAINVMEESNLVLAIFFTKYDRDKRHIKRYIRATKESKFIGSNKVRVTEA